MHIAGFAQFLLLKDIIYMLGYNCPFPFEQFCYLPLCQPYGIVFESDLKLHLIVGLVQNDFSFVFHSIFFKYNLIAKILFFFRDF